MTSDTDTVALLERALDQTAGLIAAIEPGQAGLATPCAGWDVRALVGHLAGQDLRNFLVAVRGEAADWQAPADEIGDDWAAAFQDRAAPVRAAWQAADLDSLVAGPGGEAPLRMRADNQITELAVHDWDLARATGQQLAGLDPALAEHALAWSRGMLRPEFRGPDKAFGVEVPVIFFVTVTPVPTSLSANVPVAPLVSSVTSSPLRTPTSAALLVSSVAVVMLSYTLSSAATPDTVSTIGVMSAVVVIEVVSST